MSHEDFYKDSYYHEIEQKERINARITIPAGIVTILINAVIFFISSIWSIKPSALKIAYTISLIIFVILIIGTVYCIARAFFGHQYLYITEYKEIYDYPEVLSNHYDSNIEYYKGQSIEKESFVDSSYESYLTTQYVEATDMNVKSNLKKIDWLRLVSYFFLVSLFACFLSGVLYIMSLSYQLSDEPEEISIVEIDKLVTALENDDEININEEYIEKLEEAIIKLSERIDDDNIEESETLFNIILELDNKIDDLEEKINDRTKQ